MCSCSCSCSCSCLARRLGTKREKNAALAALAPPSLEVDDASIYQNTDCGATQQPVELSPKLGVDVEETVVDNAHEDHESLIAVGAVALVCAAVLASVGAVAASRRRSGQGDMEDQLDSKLSSFKENPTFQAEAVAAAPRARGSVGGTPVRAADDDEQHLCNTHL